MAEQPKIYLYDGRQCYVSSIVRTRSKVGRSYYNAVVVRFLDGSAMTMGAVQFWKKAKNAPLPEKCGS